MGWVHLSYHVNAFTAYFVMTDGVVPRYYLSHSLQFQVHEEFARHTGKNSENELLNLININGEAVMHLARKKKEFSCSAVLGKPEGKRSTKP